MSVLRIRKYGDPILRKSAQAVSRVGDGDIKLMGNMLETMYVNEGIGLAASQIGIDKQIVVLDVGQGAQKIINPQILRKEGKAREKEGCLSLPEVSIELERADCVTVQGINEEGKEIKIEAEGLLSRVLQHEIDHLKGVLIVDYASPTQKITVNKQLKDLVKQSRRL